jgi:guanylate kinase
MNNLLRRWKMLLIISGVAGAGKDTVKKEIVKRMENVETIPSITDRPMRPRRYSR